MASNLAVRRLPCRLVAHRTWCQTVRHASTAALSTTYEKPPSPPDSRRPEDEELSDHEWEMRTGTFSGRAIDILQQTLPTFFSTGLVSHSPTSSTLAHLKNLTGLDTNRDQVSTSNKYDPDRSIYSPRIRLSYTPPTPLPSPLPTTLHIEGLPLYIASSVFIRHTLHALYTDLELELRAVRVNSTSQHRRTDHRPPELQQTHSRLNREKSLFLGFAVNGRARVSGGSAEWVVNSTYTFHPETALIHLHTIDSILPAPHSSVFDLLKSALDGVGGRVGLGAGGCMSVTGKKRE
ncbi:hypothetical protein OF83DRAFT_1072184 [Amylostereum chailletii]|nr:hypothetical protein OF83DRAFT_1072184 [Amylostereum chailletii]